MPRSNAITLSAMLCVGASIVGCGPASQMREDKTCRWLTTEAGSRLDASVLVAPVSSDGNLVQFVYHAEGFRVVADSFPDADRERFETQQRAWLRERLSALAAIRPSAELWTFSDVTNQQGTTGILALRGCEVVQIVDLVAVG